MTWKDVEEMFNRSLQLTLSRRKLIFMVPVLLFCGLMIVFCRTLAAGAGDWLGISLTFMPMFFCTAIFLAAGVILTRIYHHEVKQLSVSYRNTLSLSLDLMVEVAYLAVPVILSYLVLWTLMGLFYLLKAIPGIGDALGMLFSFGPFLLLLGLFVLCLVSLSMLFFVTPPVALHSAVRVQMLEGVWLRLRSNPFANIALMALGLIPLIFMAGMMVIAAVMTEKSYIASERTLALCIQWFFMMIPFCALLTPAVIFFFNFAAESYIFMEKRSSQRESSAI
jgi:hypothetical protein